ncbi:serine/threonine-protein kinase [Streptomyces formicae]|uniref:non-specific serine/threonine protein kinase n=1 Tax=Streptomyces formicae TaxID=1616117 RepID=A0A291QEM4_9ACTN|nr:serine/threonine-protein kinase [Streptomyces formicae]ATL29885.1 serine/threonine protein kinase [Streptomyces formicae]
MSADGGMRDGRGREGTGADGRLIGGRYRLAERIGSGGMGTVWRAVDELVGRDVAVKQPRLPGDPHDAMVRRIYARLHREARAAASVDHPAAVTIHDVVLEDGLPWIVMELIRGESLHEVLQREALPPEESARIGLAVVGALAAAHAQGIVHRDVKPANVLIGTHGRVVLTDFGIAHIKGEESLTVSGEFVGSLEFIAPERMSGRGAGPESDLWSLGVLLYAAVEGWSPFRRTTMESTLAAVLSAQAPPPERAGELGPLIERLLTKDPDLRPGAAEVAAALEAVAEGRSLPDPVEQVPAQDPSGMRELSDDVGTLRMSRRQGRRPGDDSEPGVPDPAPAPAPAPASAPAPAPASKPRRTSALLAAALAGALLVGGGVWLGVSVGGGDTSYDEGVEGAPPGSVDAPHDIPDDPSGAEKPPAKKPTAWKTRPEDKLDAEISVPTTYKVFAREDSDADHARLAARLVVYSPSEGSLLQVRLTKEDAASTPAMTWAKQEASVWRDNDTGARTNYTKTSFHGYDAAIADTTYDDGTATRCMQLMIITADQEFYELRVDMPKGTREEREGTALFKGVRERLKIGKDMTGSAEGS